MGLSHKEMSLQLTSPSALKICSMDLRALPVDEWYYILKQIYQH